MADTKKVKGFMIACKEFFGYRDGQTLKGFADEMAQVDIPFRIEIYEYLKSIGITCISPKEFRTGKVQ